MERVGTSDMQEGETKGQLGHLTPVPIELIVQRLPLQLSSHGKKIAEAGSRARDWEWNEME